MAVCGRQRTFECSICNMNNTSKHQVGSWAFSAVQSRAKLSQNVPVVWVGQSGLRHQSRHHLRGRRRRWWWFFYYFILDDDDKVQWQPHAELIIIHPSPNTTLHTEISYTIIFMIMIIAISIIVIMIISLHLIANELRGLGKSPYSSARIDYSPTK